MNMTIRIVSTILLVLSLGGCKIYKAYERPDSIVVPDSLYRQTVASSDTTSLASLSWRDLFTDKHLQRLIEYGLANNADLEVARLRVQEAEARLKASRMAYLPSVSLTPQGTLTSVGGDKPSKKYDLAVSADWEVDIFGKLLNSKRGANASLEQSEAYRQAVQTQLVATVANSYYTLLMLDKQLDVTRKTAETWKECVSVMKSLKRAGQATETAVAQTEASKLAVEGSVLSLEKQINEMENTLSVLIGRTPQGIRRSTLDAQVFPAEMSTGVPLQLLGNRPDVRQCELQLAVAYYATNVARSAFYPSVTLNGSAGWTNAAGAVVSNPGQWLLSAVVSLVQPLFNRGQNIANLTIAKAQEKEALLAFRQSLLNAGAEVNNALVQWQTARKRIDIGMRQTEALRTAVHSSELLMQYGSQNYLEVLTARQSLLQAELDVITDRFDEIQGVVNLYHALGGGL